MNVRQWCGIFLFSCISSASAELSVGVTTGAAVTDDFRADGVAYTPSSERLILGPTLRLRMRSGLGVELGALRKGLGFEYRFGRPGLGFSEYIADATAWQFPFLLQYGRTLGSVTPFIGGGPVLRWVSGGTQTGQNCTQLPSVVCTPFTQSQLRDLGDKTTAGFAIGAGAEIAAAFARLSPEVRYTRWMGQSFAAPATNDNQVELLLRIAVPIRRF